MRRPAVCLIALMATGLMLSAGGAEPRGLSQTRRERLIKRFDKDGDGRLSESEQAALRESLDRFRKLDPDQPQPQRMTWDIEGLQREALVYLPTKKKESAAPVVFGLHGHGGQARNVARTFGFQRLWPEAVVVYMQGVPTPGRLTDPEGKRTGWQHDSGVHNDRDLKFFDAVLATLQEKHSIDKDRIYATGHSNGGGFTYLLWAKRPEVLAAVAPSAAGSRSIRSLKPKPAMHIAGEQDMLVRFAVQQRVMEAVRSINGCDEEGRDWAKGCKLYPSSKDAPFVAFIHPGSHKYPDEAPPLIVRFFKQHARQADATQTKRNGLRTTRAVISRT